MTRYNVAAFSAQSAQPSFRYGQRAKLPLQNNAATVHVRATIPADIPDNAIVTKADLVFEIDSAYVGAKTFNLQKHSAKFDNTITWTGRPGVTGAVVSTTVTSPAAGDTFALSVMSDAQGFIAGTIDNFGWRLSTTSATQALLKGITAATGVPYLDLEYVLPGEPPTDLAPAGRIATGNPTLTFRISEETTHIQVQVSIVDDFSSTAYDSGEVIATGGGVFELTGYTIPDGATRYHRVRGKSGGVWSEWAEAEVVRDDFAAGAITAPGATTGNPTPEITWTFPGQDAWQAQVVDGDNGRVLADSGRTAGTTQAWIPPEGRRGEGPARAVVRLWDDKADRVPTPGIPAHLELVHDFNVDAVGVDTGLEDLAATQRGATPIIDLTWNIPVALPAGSKIQILRNGRFLTVVDRTDTAYADRTAPRFANLTYKVAVINPAGDVSTLGPTDLIYPRSAGVWLLDPDVDFADTAAAVILGKEQPPLDMSEQAVVHAVHGRAAVRRRIGLPPPSGEFSGPVMTALGVTAAETYTNIMAWKPRDAGTVYRLVFGDWNIPVTVGDLFAYPTTNLGDEAQYFGGFKWWQTDSELPWG